MKNLWIKNLGWLKRSFYLLLFPVWVSGSELPEYREAILRVTNAIWMQLKWTKFVWPKNDSHMSTWSQEPSHAHASWLTTAAMPWEGRHAALCLLPAWYYKAMDPLCVWKTTAGAALTTVLNSDIHDTNKQIWPFKLQWLLWPLKAAKTSVNDQRRSQVL